MHSRARDALTAARQALPWERVEKDYRFTGPEGEVSLYDLFDGRSQLLVQHFMFEPGWDEGCKSCSLMADHLDPSVVHLAARDVTFVAVSRAPPGKLEAYKQRLGWNFPWVSSYDSDFNYDFDVSFSAKDIANKDVYYDYSGGIAFPSSEGPGLSEFFKDDNGAIYHTYSVYSRGLEATMGVYVLLDMVAKGRDEDALSFTMEWVRRNDEYAKEEALT